MFQYVVAVFLLRLCYMLTTCYYVVTTSLLHVYYLLLYVYYFFTTCLLLFLYIVYGQTPPLVLVPSSHYYLGSLSWTSRTFYFLDSRDLLEVLRDFLGREREGGVPRGSSRTLGDPPWGLSLSLSLPRRSLRTSRRSRESGK